MAAEGGVGEELETMSMSSGSLTPLSSPRKNDSVKLLCSHGGKILPRPSNGQLKYIGGETRVVSIPRDMNYSDLMRKLHEVFNEEMMFKYPLMPEDLDTLVSVKNDEDVKHMLEEYDRHDILGTPKLRAFLYPLKPIPADRPAVETRVEKTTVETRALNGGVGRPSPNLRITPIRSFRAGGSSTCSSPQGESPESRYNSGDGNVANNKNDLMHKVQSSPSLVSLNVDNIQQYSNGYSSYQHHHNHYHHHHGQGGHTPHKHSQDPYRTGWGERRLMRSTSSRMEPGRAQHLWSAPPEIYYPNTRQYCRDYGQYSRSERYDEYGNLCGSSRFDRDAESLPYSPR